MAYGIRCLRQQVQYYTNTIEKIASALCPIFEDFLQPLRKISINTGSCEARESIKKSLGALSRPSHCPALITTPGTSFSIRIQYFLTTTCYPLYCKRRLTTREGEIKI